MLFFLLFLSSQLHKQFRDGNYTMSFGSDPKNCDVVLHMDENVSGEHSFIQWHEGTEKFYYVDDSMNGSIVNGEQGEKGTSIIIDDGATVILGTTHLTVHIRDMEEDEEEIDDTEDDTESDEEEEEKNEGEQVVVGKKRKFVRRATVKIIRPDEEVVASEVKQKKKKKKKKHKHKKKRDKETDEIRNWGGEPENSSA